MPEMTALPDGVVRMVEIEGFSIPVTPEDRYLVLARHCNGEEVFTGASSPIKMTQIYAKTLARIVTETQYQDKHVIKVVCLQFKDDGSGLFRRAPIIYPQPDQARQVCDGNHEHQKITTPEKPESLKEKNDDH